MQAGRGGAGRDAALAPALKLKPGAFGFMGDRAKTWTLRSARTAGGGVKTNDGNSRRPADLFSQEGRGEMQSCAYYYLYYFLRQKQAQNQRTLAYLSTTTTPTRRTRRRRYFSVTHHDALEHIVANPAVGVVGRLRDDLLHLLVGRLEATVVGECLAELLG